MTSILIADTPLRGECQVDVTDEILGETPSLGNFFSAATPPSNPSPVDDALAIARFDDWLFSEHSPEAVGDECFPTAVAVATVLREQGFSMPFAQDRVESWILFACSPQLEQAEIDLAVREAYSRSQPSAQATPAPSTAAEQAKQPDDVSPPSPIVDTTTPSPLTAAALADTTTPAITTSECALCAARRKAKRERTRRWRALRARPATKREVGDAR